MAKSSVTPVEGLLLWNKLGSEEEVVNSEVGPTGLLRMGEENPPGLLASRRASSASRPPKQSTYGSSPVS